MFSQDDVGFAVATTGSVNMWSPTEIGTFQPMIKSIEVQWVEPTPVPTDTPVPTPTPVATATPPQPTAAPQPPQPAAPQPQPDDQGKAQPAAPAETPAPPVETGIYSSARDAFDAAALLATDWNPAAGLTSIGCASMRVEGDRAGKCRRWTIFFTEPTTGTEPAGTMYRVTLSDGELANAGETPSTAPVEPMAGAWIDSPEALQTALDGGLSGFLKRHPEASTTAVLEAGRWTIDTGTPSGDLFVVCADAASGAIDALVPAPPAAEGKLLSARQVLPLAQKKAKEWQADARLVGLGAELGLAGAGAEGGKALEWQVVFTSEAAAKARTFSIRGGQAEAPEDATPLAQTPITGMWPDSPKAMQDLGTNEDYTSFSELYPSTHSRWICRGRKQRASCGRRPPTFRAAA